VMLTAAVRDLHQCYPGEFITDVRTPYPHLWNNNPHLTALDERDSDVRTIECHYPLIHHSNQRPYHFIHAFIAYLNEQLSLDIKPTAFKGDIHLSHQETTWYSQVHEIVGDNRPFWIIAAGGKFDFTNKWWVAERYQEVVDHFRGKICFVQIGRLEDHHPPLEGVIDLRGKTDLRQVIRLVYHSQGVLCPVTLLMHLAAAVPIKVGGPTTRPCVVVAGGREPSHWEAYPHHQFIHTIGALPCCDTGGCWKSRTIPIGDGDEKDRPENLCVNVVRNLPKCMEMITSAEVARRIEMYFLGGVARYVESTLEGGNKMPPKMFWEEPTKEREFTHENCVRLADEAIKSIPTYPGLFRGRGIVICAGGTRYFTNAWVCINMLRHLGCTLPIQMWYQGANELDETMRTLARKLNVQCVDAEAYKQNSPCKALTGWSLKPYAIINCPFKEVLLLDADNVPLINPELLFEEVHFRDVGAVFWPDYGRFAPSSPAWALFGVPFRNEPEFESGQILVNKQKCWRALLLTMWYNANSSFYYSHVHGDKDTYRMAFRKLNQPFFIIPHRVAPLSGTMCQHDFGGKRIFQHRNLAKWELHGENRRISGFLKEDECFGFLDELRREWSGIVARQRSCDPNDPIVKNLVANVYLQKSDAEKARDLTFNENGTIGLGSAEHAQRWDLRKERDGTAYLQLFGETGLTGELALEEDGIWRSRWMRFNRTSVEISMVCEPRFRIGTTDQSIWKSVYEQNAYGLPKYFHPDAVIIDVGAHTGSFACACIARGARYVYAYEPDNANYQLAVENVSKWFRVHKPRERHSPVCLEQVAILSAECPNPIGISPYPIQMDKPDLSDTGGCAAIFSTNAGVTTRSIALDLILNELPHVTLMKLHCEGAEWPILFGSGLLTRVERIIVQLHSLKRKREAAHYELATEIQVNLKSFEFSELVTHLGKAGFVRIVKTQLEHSPLEVASADSPTTELGLAHFRKSRSEAASWDW